MTQASVTDVRNERTPTLMGTAIVPKKDVANTRLQLRWVKDEVSSSRYICLYELALALDAHDVRREQSGPRGGRKPDRINQVVNLGQTSRGSANEPCYMPCDGRLMLHFDAPYRDGAHAHMDAAKLGGLPIYVVTVGGVYLSRVEQTL